MKDDAAKRMMGAFRSQLVTEDIILEQTKRKQNIVYGAQSVKKQLGMFARPTFDYDIYSKTPHQDAQEVRRKLNEAAKANIYYDTQSKKTKGVYKVYYVGQDGKPYTKDDKGIVDYSELKKGIRYVIINGIRYSVLDSTIRDKKRALTEEQYAFRHKKDQEDLNRIQGYQTVRKIPIVNKII